MIWQLFWKDNWSSLCWYKKPTHAHILCFGMSVLTTELIDKAVSAEDKYGKWH
jgi:hypothetical protein